MKQELSRQEVKDINYTSATLASNALADAQGEIWTATGDYIEYQNPAQHLDRAEALVKKALEEIGNIKAAIAAEKRVE